MMLLSTGTVYGARYYTVEPVISWDLNGDWGSINTWSQMEAWCVDSFGSTGPIWDVEIPIELQRWYMNNAKFWFRDEKDREWFILRWS